jgi:hypothetical protein
MNTTPFFRAFDLAFFVPGSLILMHLLYTFRESTLWEKLEKAGDKTAIGIIYVVGIVILAFVIGLLCHCISRIIITKNGDKVLSFGQTQPNQIKNGRQYGNEDRSRVDYFWYLRATCWNTSVAFGIMSTIELLHSMFFGNLCNGYSLGIIPAFLISSMCMWYLGCDYHRAYEARINSPQIDPSVLTIIDKSYPIPKSQSTTEG